MRYVLALLVCAACGGDGSADCTLSCGVQSTMRADVPTVALSCGSNSINCTNTLDQFGRITSLSCSYSNGKHAGCTGVSYNNIGQITGGTCTGEGQTCTLP
jgi:hypothetical protein